MASRTAKTNPAADALEVMWAELRTLDAANWHIDDGAALLNRAASKDLRGWGRADQILPDL